MLKLAKNKKGMSMIEMIAAIMIIGITSTTLTSMVINSYKTQLRATQYVLAEEIAKTYDSILARDIKKSNLKAIDGSRFKDASDPTKKYIEVGEDLLKDMTKISDTENAPVYISLYSDTKTDHFQLNNNYYDSENVSIEIYMISASWGYYKTKITVSYSTNRKVTYSGTHFSE